MFRTWIFLKEVVQLGKTERKKKKKKPTSHHTTIASPERVLAEGEKKKRQDFWQIIITHTFVS